MRSLFLHILFFFSFAMLIACGRSQEGINSEAQKLFDNNLEELNIMADDSCAKKRPGYVEIYKDSLTKANSQTELPIGDE
jgi:hypothetical protein